MHGGGVSMIRKAKSKTCASFLHLLQRRGVSSVLSQRWIKYECWKINFKANYHPAECGTDGRRINLICHDTLRFLQLFAPLSPVECFSRSATLHEPRVRQLHAIGMVEGHHPPHSGFPFRASTCSNLVAPIEKKKNSR